MPSNCADCVKPVFGVDVMQADGCRLPRRDDMVWEVVKLLAASPVQPTVPAVWDHLGRPSSYLHASHYLHPSIPCRTVHFLLT